MKRKGAPAIPAKRGGCRQRLAKVAEQENALKQRSELSDYLLMMWSWGLMSTPQVQSIMQKARADMDLFAAGTLDASDVDMVAGIRAHGIVAQAKLSCKYKGYRCVGSFASVSFTPTVGFA